MSVFEGLGRNEEEWVGLLLKKKKKMVYFGILFYLWKSYTDNTESSHTRLTQLP